jgi:hypothetical protein
MANNASPSTQNDLRRLQMTAFSVSGQIQDQNRLGTLGAAVGITTPAVGTDFTVKHPLGRIPNGYLCYRSALGGVLHDPPDGSARWTSQTIVLRSTVAGDTVSMLIL